MKNFAQLDEDGLEQIRTRIENTLREHHQSFLGFFPSVSIQEGGHADTISFHAIPQSRIIDKDDEQLPPDLTIDIDSSFGIAVSGKAIEATGSAAVIALIKTTIHEYLVEEGFMEAEA